MIVELRLMSPAGLTLRAACGRLSRSTRLLIADVKSWRSGGSLLQKSKFKNHHSSINSSSPNGV
jgi:hypothetical protein